MSGNFYLDWAILAVSLTNVILLGWLGLTVLLNAEHRTWGVWLTGGGLLLAAGFFVSHTAILGLGTETTGYNLNLWWRTGWLPLVALPLGWYVMVLWHVGFWDGRHDIQQAGIRRAQQQLGHTWLASGWSWGRMLLWYAGISGPTQPGSAIPRTFSRSHRYGLPAAFVLLLLLTGLLLFSGALPSFTQAIQYDFTGQPTLGGFSLFLVIFPGYVILCIVLALDALRHPAPSARLMGDQARRRARPWLFAATSVLLLVSLLVSVFIAWVMLAAQAPRQIGRAPLLEGAIAWFDLVIDGLLLCAIVLVGQAIIAYEVFTGKSLPRSELRRYWVNALILAGGLGTMVGLTLARPAQPVYSLLLVILLVTLFYALLTWRSYTRREEFVRQLRPFLGSQHLYERLLRIPLQGAELTLPSQMPPDVDAAALFASLCTDVLGVRRALLVAVGPLAPLVGPPLTYPAQAPLPPLSFADVMASFPTPQMMGVPLDPARYDGLIWAVPLWSERGLIGLFLLGPKADEGLYTQEAIEIARASGERLIDTRASAEIARSLIALQRQRLVESQLLDRHTRRVLHDEILPQVHAALLTLGTSGAATTETATLLTAIHHQLADLLREMPARGAPPVVKQGLLTALRHLLADELHGAFDEVAWEIDPAAAERLLTLPPLTVEVLFYAAREAIRNAARYGRGVEPARPLHLRISVAIDNGLVMKLEDNGVGLQPSTPNQTGSGEGVALHSTMLAIVGGTLSLQSTPGHSTCVTLKLP
jgi:signal transduction histidine kinase